ncbi:hypothetical protein [Nocardia sp. Marseille-Q1738]
MTERSEGTNQHSTYGHDAAERQRGGVVTERSEGTNQHSTYGHDAAERQRGGVVTERGEGAIQTAGATRPSEAKS